MPEKKLFIDNPLIYVHYGVIMAYEVSIIKCGSYDEHEVEVAVQKSLLPLGGIGSVVKAGDRVLVKPNLLTSQPPGKAATTHPAVVKAVIRQVQAAGGRPVLGDSPGGASVATAYSSLLEKTGMKRIADETGCPIVRFNDEPVQASMQKARHYRKITLSKAVMDADVIIGVSKLKTHSLTYYTGAIKLLYGYIPGLVKTEYHLHTGKDVRHFADMLLDIYESYPPALNVMDAIVGMEGPGPQHGSPRDIGLVMASKSGPALDFAAVSVIGFDPEKVPTVRQARERGIGPSAVSDITVYGEPVESVRITGFKAPDTMTMSRIPVSLIDAANRIFSVRPAIDASKCKMCGVCAESCPSKAIRFAKGSVPSIKHKDCLRCFCCQELCPENAVSVKKPLLRKLIR